MFTNRIESVSIFGHFLAFLALNATFGIEDILFLPVSRPSGRSLLYEFGNGKKGETA
jgi:hypothetical protein